MCGRFYLDVPKDEFLAHYQLVDAPILPPRRYNIAPSQDILAVRAIDSGERTVSLLHWGLIPSWSKEEKSHFSMINARAETVASKPAFRAAFKRRRCLIPASGFYEWQPQDHYKQPYAICMKDNELFSLAGLWEHWESPEGKLIESCSIIVTNANAVLKPIHDRMPVILAPEDYETWLDPENHDTDSLSELLTPYSSGKMKAYPVSRKMNDPSHDEHDCIEPITAD
jgi:putative SOS response-associated peptidase YedK